MKRPEKINGGYQPSSLHHGEGTPKPPKGGTGKTEPKHTFPTWEEFQKWSPFLHQDTKVIYDYFRNRIQPLEIGREYEFSNNGEKWTLDNLDGYLGKYANWQHIRPIQAVPKETLIDVLKKARSAQDGEYMRIHGRTIDEAIKALEATK
jgi:hypothetical protein